MAVNCIKGPRPAADLHGAGMSMNEEQDYAQLVTSAACCMPPKLLPMLQNIYDVYDMKPEPGVTQNGACPRAVPQQCSIPLLLRHHKCAWASCLILGGICHAFAVGGMQTAEAAWACVFSFCCGYRNNQDCLDHVQMLGWTKIASLIPGNFHKIACQVGTCASAQKMP